MVHIDHGVGRYLGLTITGNRQPGRRIPRPGIRRERQAVRAGGQPAPDRALHRQRRRTGPAAPPRLRDMAESQAQSRRAGARRRRRTARHLRPPRRARRLRIRRPGKPITPPSAPASRSRKHRTSTATIEAVREDMLAPKPMDRLVCGDVGFGKTEVAMRAAFIAVHGGTPGGDAGADHAARPAALQQLPRPLRRLAGDRRSADAASSRPSEVKAAVADGWPKARSTSSSARTSLLSDDVKFKNLGLVIIDEEHRFGVRQKEAAQGAAQRTSTCSP